MSSEVVYIIDDDSSVRKSLARLLRSAGYAVEVFSSAVEFLEAPPTTGPRCLVLDINMPGLTGMDLQTELLARNLPVAIVFITGHGDVKTSVQAMKNGAVDFLPKPYNDTELLSAIDHALEKDRTYLEEEKQKAAINELLRSLTPAENDVLRWVITGKLNKQIAQHLGITEKTVKVHRGRVMQKLKVSSVADLVRLAQKAAVEPAKS